MGLSNTSVTTYAINITWMAPSGSNVQRFVVLWNESDEVCCCLLCGFKWFFL